MQLSTAACPGTLGAPCWGRLLLNGPPWTAVVLSGASRHAEQLAAPVQAGVYMQPHPDRSPTCYTHSAGKQAGVWTRQALTRGQAWQMRPQTAPWQTAGGWAARACLQRAWPLALCWQLVWACRHWKHIEPVAMGLRDVACQARQGACTGCRHVCLRCVAHHAETGGQTGLLPGWLGWRGRALFAHCAQT